MDKPFYLRRPNILPKSIGSSFFFIFISLVIPLTYWFELWIVLPYIFSNYPLLYWSFFILGHFLLHNVVGNFLAILMLDTSIRGREMPNEKEPGVQYCVVCATYTPPRSFHCSSCDICILKRDHHCDFTNCCIGFYNHRFYLFFIFYITLSTLISLPFNIYFLYNSVLITNKMCFLNLAFPFFMYILNTNMTCGLDRIYIITSIIGVLGGSHTLFLLHFHLNLILKGKVAYEMKKCINTYNLGTMKNLKLVLGKRWYLTFLSPYIKSPLICDGIKFPVVQKEKCS